MKDLSRRDFGKSVSVGALGSLAASSVAQVAQGQGTSAQNPKRMTTVLHEMIKRPGIIAAPGIYDPITARTAERIGFRALDLPGSALGYATTMMEPNLTLEDMAARPSPSTSSAHIPW